MSRTYSARIRLGLGAAALMAPFAGALAAQAQPDGDTPALKDVFADHFLIGAAISPFAMRRPETAALIARHFNSVTAENVMKPNYLTDESGAYTWDAADELAAFAEAHDMKLRGHTLLWHRRVGNSNAAPYWMFEGDDPVVIRNRLETFIHNVVSRYRGKVYAWDVVNEVASIKDGEVYRIDTSPWHQALGPDYIEWAFRAAHEADPECQLFINDFDTEDAPKLQRLMRIVDDLQDKGVPLHGVGHQLHMKYADDIAGAEAAIVATEARGLINHVTELDVSVYNDPGSCFADRSTCLPDFGAPENIPADRLAAQARLYGDLFDMFLRHESVKSVTTWGVTDAGSWLNGFPVPRTNAPLLFDRQGAPKDGFWNIVRPRSAGA
jgi:endo-1,4-beta-xylanase